MAGSNRWKSRAARALQNRDSLSTKSLPVVRLRPCVFISYRLADNEVARAVAHFLMFTADCDMYFSDSDAALLDAVSGGNNAAVVEAIDAGITESTYLLGIITNQTKGSWWVPYEFGACRMRKLPVAVLLVEEVKQLPPHMKIATALADRIDVSSWAHGVSPTLRKSGDLPRPEIPRIPAYRAAPTYGLWADGPIRMVQPVLDLPHGDETIASWLKITNPDYRQMRDRHELFASRGRETRRSRTLGVRTSRCAEHSGAGGIAPHGTLTVEV
jgi:hypothetical protein